MGWELKGNGEFDADWSRRFFRMVLSGGYFPRQDWHWSITKRGDGGGRNAPSRRDYGCSTASDLGLVPHCRRIFTGGWRRRNENFAYLARFDAQPGGAQAGFGICSLAGRCGLAIVAVVPAAPGRGGYDHKEKHQKVEGSEIHMSVFGEPLNGHAKGMARGEGFVLTNDCRRRKQQRRRSDGAAFGAADKRN